MPLGTPVLSNTGQVDRVVRPAQIPNPWVTVVDAGGVDDSDGSPITNPSVIDSSTTHIFKVGKKGKLEVKKLHDFAPMPMLMAPASAECKVELPGMGSPSCD